VAILIVSPLEERYATRRSRHETVFLRVVRHPVLIRLTLVTLCFGFGFSAHCSFVAPYAQSKGMLASLYFSAYSIAAICTRLVGGRLADRFGEPRIVPVSLIVTGIGFICQLIVDSPIDFIVSCFITGTGHGMVLPCLMALAIRPVSPQNRGKANGVLTGGMDLGIFCGSLALGLIGERLGYKVIFTVAGMSMFAGFVLFMVWLQRFPPISYRDA
jgi:predicted MFS family arabinose efflux permease